MGINRGNKDGACDSSLSFEYVLDKILAYGASGLKNICV